MSETHLHAVDPQGQATASPPNGGGAAGTPSRTRAVQKARPKYPVPTDRLKFELQEKALRVVCTASRGGTEPVDAAKMAGLLHVAAVTAPLNNAFFASVGLLERSGKGEYLPTSLALEYQRRYSFDPKAARAVLAPAFTGTWFFDAVDQRLAVSPATRDQMIGTLASVAQTDDSYRPQYGLLLDWLEYVGLIEIVDGMVKMIVTVDGPASATEAIEPAESDSPQPAVAAHMAKRDDGGRARGPSVLSFRISLDVSAEDLASLTAEQISSLFDGVAKVASVRAALASAD